MADGRDRAGILLHEFDKHISDTTVIRIQQKVFGLDEVLDVRLWGVAKAGNLYPKRGKGITMKVENWRHVLRMFDENKLIPNVSLTTS